MREAGEELISPALRTTPPSHSLQGEVAAGVSFPGKARQFGRRDSGANTRDRSCDPC